MKQRVSTIIGCATVIATTLLANSTPSFGNTSSFENNQPRTNRRQDPPWGTAPRSWCLGIKEQWEFRKQHFGEDSQSIRAMFEDNNCAYWGITPPGSEQLYPQNAEDLRFPGDSQQKSTFPMY